MALGLDPKLPLVGSADWIKRLVRRLNELLRQWAQTINPWIGPSWEDLRFPAQSINPSGAPTGASFDTTTRPGTLIFSGTAENHVAGVAQLPHSWLEGSAIRPHIHWTKVTADPSSEGVTWQLRYAIAGINEVIQPYASYTTATLVAGNLFDAEHHNISGFGDIALTGYLGSTMILWQLRRLGNTDSATTDCRLLEMDFHYQIGQVGSSNKAEYPGILSKQGVWGITATITLAGVRAGISQVVAGQAATITLAGVTATVVGYPVTITATAATWQLKGVRGVIGY